MPQPSKGPRLGGSPDHQKLMLANLATSLFTHGRIHTTRAKADRLRPYAERLITKAKKGDLHNRRIIQEQIRDKDVVHRLLAEIGPFFADRPGGYTRIVKTLPRKGDNAPMAIIELVNERTASAEASQATRVAAPPTLRRVRAPRSVTPRPVPPPRRPRSRRPRAARRPPRRRSPRPRPRQPRTARPRTTATEDTTESSAAADDVPEDMADNAAASAGLETSGSDSDSDKDSDKS